MMFWQLTIDANDPAVLARFWAQALGYQPVPPTEPATTWHALYRARLGEDAAFGDRLFDPAGLRPPIWFQQVPEAKAGKNRTDQAGCQRGAANPARRSEGPDLLRGHARPGRQRVLRRLNSPRATGQRPRDTDPCPQLATPPLC
jgi:hypothetical protein